MQVFYREKKTIKTKILTHLAYIGNGKKSCPILQQNHWIVWRLVPSFYDVILPIVHVSLTLDAVTTFLRIMNLKNICKRLGYSQNYLRDSSVQWPKVGRI